jgi:hypothetical protein
VKQADPIEGQFARRVPDGKDGPIDGDHSWRIGDPSVVGRCRGRVWSPDAADRGTPRDLFDMA